MKCSICKKPMKPEDDCGGDCTDCMIESGDIDCAKSLINRLREEVKELKKTSKIPHLKNSIYKRDQMILNLKKQLENQ
jgi:hypothetical protein